MKTFVRLLAASTLAIAAAAPAAATITWSVSGPGNVTLTTTGNTQSMNYALQSNTVFSGQTWTLTGVSSNSANYTLNWASSGFYSFFQVRASATAVDSVGTQTLYNFGPANCCSPPSGGFSYSGAVTVKAVAGQPFSFNVFGRNFDSARVLGGSFSVTPISSTVPEPASWAMLLAGFGFVGAVSRRTRGQTVAA